MQSPVPHDIRIADGCALHQGQPFVAICRRCGSYMCSQCNEAGRFPQCPACRGRTESSGTSFPFRRDNLALGRLLAFTFQAYKRNFGMVTLATAASMFIVGLIHSASYAVQSLFADELVTMLVLSILLFVVQAVVQGVLGLGVLAITLRVMQGEPAELRMLFGGFRRLGALFLQGMVTNTALMLGAALTIAPPAALFLGISEPSLLAIGLASVGSLVAAVGTMYLALGFGFATIELVAAPRIDAFEAVKNSWRIASHARLKLLLALLLLGALAFVGAIACLIGLVFTLSFGALFYTGVYLGLSNGVAELRR